MLLFSFLKFRKIGSMLFDCLLHPVRLRLQSTDVSLEASDGTLELHDSRKVGIANHEPSNLTGEARMVLEAMAGEFFH